MAGMKAEDDSSGRFLPSPPRLAALGHRSRVWPNRKLTISQLARELVTQAFAAIGAPILSECRNPLVAKLGFRFSEPVKEASRVVVAELSTPLNKMRQCRDMIVDLAQLFLQLDNLRIEM